MELRRYWAILWRRLWVILVLTVGAAALSYWLSPEAQATYVATTRLLVSIPPEPRTGPYFSYDRYYNWVAADYLTDDLADVVKSQAFADDIRAELGGDALDMASLQGEASAEKTHRVLTVRVAAKDPEQARRIAAAVGSVIEKKGKEYLAQLQEENALVRVIDPPLVSGLGTGPRNYLDMGLRTGLGFLAGLALVFLLHYLDPTLREVEEVEQLLGLPVLGEIPPERR